MGLSIAGIESAGIPEFAEKIVNEGLEPVSYDILPHADNIELADMLSVVRKLHEGKDEIIELKDSQAVIFQDDMSPRKITLQRTCCSAFIPTAMAGIACMSR